jgi:subfamily B ATP-binding cassette protein MsbA
MSKPAKLPFPQLVRAFWGPYLRLLTYVKPYRKRFFLGIACGVVAGSLSAAIPLVIKLAAEALMGAGSKLPSKSQMLAGAFSDEGPGIESVL